MSIEQPRRRLFGRRASAQQPAFDPYQPPRPWASPYGGGPPAGYVNPIPLAERHWVERLDTYNAHLRITPIETMVPRSPEEWAHLSLSPVMFAAVTAIATPPAEVLYSVRMNYGVDVAGMQPSEVAAALQRNPDIANLARGLTRGRELVAAQSDDSSAQQSLRELSNALHRLENGTHAYEDSSGWHYDNAVLVDYGTLYGAGIRAHHRMGMIESYFDQGLETKDEKSPRGIDVAAVAVDLYRPGGLLGDNLNSPTQSSPPESRRFAEPMLLAAIDTYRSLTNATNELARERTRAERAEQSLAGGVSSAANTQAREAATALNYPPRDIAPEAQTAAAVSAFSLGVEGNDVSARHLRSAVAQTILTQGLNGVAEPYLSALIDAGGNVHDGVRSPAAANLWEATFATSASESQPLSYAELVTAVEMKASAEEISSLYSGLVRATPERAMLLGVVGHDAASNQARGEIASQLVAEGSRRSNLAYEQAHWMSEPNLAEPFGLAVVNSAAGDLTTALTDQRFAAEVADRLGYTIDSYSGDDSARSFSSDVADEASRIRTAVVDLGGAPTLPEPSARATVQDLLARAQAISPQSITGMQPDLSQHTTQATAQVTPHVPF